MGIYAADLKDDFGCFFTGIIKQVTAKLTRQHDPHFK